MAISGTQITVTLSVPPDEGCLGVPGTETVFLGRLNPGTYSITITNTVTNQVLNDTFAVLPPPIPAASGFALSLLVVAVACVGLHVLRRTC